MKRSRDPEDGPVQHDRRAADVIARHVFRPRRPGMEIDLHGAALPGTTDGVLDVEFDLGAVKAPSPAIPSHSSPEAQPDAGRPQPLSHTSSEPTRPSGRSANLTATSWKPKSP